VLGLTTSSLLSASHYRYIALKSVPRNDIMRIMDCNRNRNDVMIMLPVQCRMARAALGLGVRELAAAAKVSTDTVARFERGDELKRRTIDALQLALEAAGVEFTNGDQPGVHLIKGAATPRRVSRAAIAPKGRRSKKGRRK
jgi:transcriptional regulator with XRE-family HTH domain